VCERKEAVVAGPQPQHGLVVSLESFCGGDGVVGFDGAKEEGT
jgi:hypothetical protein